jgi:hypothetical protein
MISRIARLKEKILKLELEIARKESDFAWKYHICPIDGTDLVFSENKCEWWLGRIILLFLSLFITHTFDWDWRCPKCQRRF